MLWYVINIKQVDGRVYKFFHIAFKNTNHRAHMMVAKAYHKLNLHHLWVCLLREAATWHFLNSCLSILPNDGFIWVWYFFYLFLEFRIWEIVSSYIVFFFFHIKESDRNNNIIMPITINMRLILMVIMNVVMMLLF